MIALQRLNGSEFVLNEDLIEIMESTPDTVLRLTTGKTMIVKNDIADIMEKCIHYRILCRESLPMVARKVREQES